MSSDTPTWKESITLDETNKIRISLGLKPLSDSGPSKTTDALAEENFQKRKEQEAKEKEAAALKARIDKARNTLDRGRKLVGVGLGADEMEGIKVEEGVAAEADAKAWVKKQKKRAKELAAKREKEIAEMDKRFEEEGLPKYGEDDLKGIKVLHGEEDFEEGEETILTLRDTRVLDDEDDELHNLNISENAKTAEALALKKKGRLAGTYTGYDDDEFEGGIGAKRSVLSKYDEEIEGREDGGFRLGGPVAPSKKAGKGKEREQDHEEKERVKLTMDYTKSFTTDYLQEDEVGFKQKKKKKRATRVMTHALADDSMDIDGASTSTPAIPRHTNLDETNLIDDDDLQASLARTRRELNKKKIAAMKTFAATAPPPPTNGMDVDGIKEESDDEGANDYAPTGGDDDVIVMDDTSEFVRNITLAAAARTAAAAAAAIKVEASGTGTPAAKASNGAASVMPVIKAEPEDVPLSEVAVGGWGPAREDGEESDEEMAMEEGEEVSGQEEEEEEKKPLLDDDGFGGTAAEALVSRGMASTLNLLRHQGLIKVRTPEEQARDKQQKEKEKWLAEQRRRDREREEERRRAKEAGSSKDQQTREYENRMREREEAQATHEAYANYKPVVNLTYHDEFGRDQTPKEAWKQLSHNFHGHGSGTKKTEKRLKKIEEERKRETMGSGDTPLATATAFAARAERMGSATMVLSVGNKGAAPIQEEMLANLNKDAALKKAKGKGKATAPKPSRASSSAPPSNASFDILRPLPLPASETRSGSPAVRAGFTPVGGFASRAAEGRSDSPAGVEKLIIPVSVKRKPVADAEGGPSRKK